MLNIVLENENTKVFSEREAKLELSKVNLDYTYLSHLFIPIKEDNVIKYIKQLNFDFCIEVIHAKLKLERAFPTNW